MKRFRNWVKKLREDQRGLTLVELLAVIVILAIVGLIAFVAIGSVIENSKKDAHVANAQQLISAAKLAEATQDFPANGFTTGTPENGQKELDTVEDLTNPWDPEDESYKGTVTKEGNEYRVTIEGNNTITLAITNVPESTINEGRDAVENYTPTTP